MPHFENRAELCGSVAGYADGTIAENLYSDSTVGGVDGFSFTGQTDYMDYEDFAALPDTPDFFPQHRSDVCKGRRDGGDGRSAVRRQDRLGPLGRGQGRNVLAVERL